MEDNAKIVLIGNPNVGKSVIFGFLTGRYVTVSNYPGTTVEISTGKAKFDDSTEEVIDTPGVNSLMPYSEDEKVTRDILLKECPRLVIQVADAKNLRRALFLSVQLAEMKIPFILNMMDEARSRGVSLDREQLEEILGVSAVETVAIHGQGLMNLVDEIRDSLKVSKLDFDYPEEIEFGISEITQFLPSSWMAKRALALMLLAGDVSLKEWLRQNLDSFAVQKIETIREEVQAKLQES
ncbi:MAG: FeoB small GTPase domain-containing protein, partial [bacterium]